MKPGTSSCRSRVGHIAHHTHRGKTDQQCFGSANDFNRKNIYNVTRVNPPAHPLVPSFIQISVFIPSFPTSYTGGERPHGHRVHASIMRQSNVYLTMTSPVFLQLSPLAPTKKQAKKRKDSLERGRGLVLDSGIWIRYPWGGEFDSFALLVLHRDRHHQRESSAGTSSNLREKQCWSGLDAPSTRQP